MTRSQFLLPLACLLLLWSAVVVFRREPIAPQPPAPKKLAVEPPRPVNIKTVSQRPTVTTITTVHHREKIIPLAGPLRPAAPPLPESILPPVVLTTSSWENPFNPELWKSEGWRFSPQGMESLMADSSSATFARTYQRLMVECDLVGDKSAEGTWEFRLSTQNGSRMSFVVHADRIAVLTTEADITQRVLEKPLPAHVSGEVPRQFRIVATGNRIVVSWDRRRLLTTEQLASQSGHDVEWSLHALGATYKIPRLRVEGD